MRLVVLKNNLPINDVVIDTTDLSERHEIFVGRSEDCHVIVDDPLISRHHFVLKNEGNKFYCHKLTTVGSVSVNGSVLPVNEIREQDEIRCGVYSFVVSQIPLVNSFTSASTIANEPQVTPSAPFISAQEKLDEIDDFMAENSSEPLEEQTTVIKDEEESIGELYQEKSEEFSEKDESFDDSFSSEESHFESSAEDSSLVASDEFSENSSFGDADLEVTDDEKTSVFKTFVNYQLLLFGEYAPYDRYEIDHAEIFIGRDPKKCQIVLEDPEVSSVHAVLRKNLIEVTLEDLNSSNGTIFNGERINKARLVTGDEFVIGSTSFTLETRSDLLEAEAGRLMPVAKDQVIETEEIEDELVDAEDGDLDFSQEAPKDKSLFKRIKNDPAFRKKVIYVVAGLAVILLLFGEDEKPAPAQKAPVVVEKKDEKPQKILSPELQEKRNMAYELGVSFFEQQKYFEALKEFQTVMDIDNEYKNISSYFEQTKAGLKRLEELEAEKRAEEERIKNKKIVEELVVKAREATKDRLVSVAESYFAQIVEKDPENFEVQQMRMELEAWQKEQERLALEKATREAARKAMVDALSPGKTFYLKKEWYRAILRLEEFLRRQGTDEDLIKEASDMLSDAKNQLASDLGPLVGKARSLKEGQDLKQAYQAYLDILKIEPTHEEALNEVDAIKESLDSRSKKIYREAIISESLSLFNDAKEKFQEVQQISPSDSEYYRKASEKLKSYME